MRRSICVIALALLAPVAGSASVNAQTVEPDGLHGGFKMTVHTHSNNNPNSPTLRFPTDRLSYEFVEGENFSYSSRLCGGRAPFNDLGLDFNPDYPGVDDDADGTAAVRHRVEGTITEVSGDRGTLEGTITTVLCVPGPNGTQVESDNDQIVFTFEARYRRVSEDQVRIMGRYEIDTARSTGTFADLEGHGSIQGIFTCLGSAICAQLGHFTDFVGVRGDPTKGPGELTPGLVGTFSDPTVEPV